MKSSVLRTAQAHDVASVREVLKLQDNALSLAGDTLGGCDSSLVQSIEPLRDFPFLLAHEAGRCCGFAYARPHCSGAYRWSADVALHFDPQAAPAIAERLYRQLLRDLTAQGYLAAYALVAPGNAPAVALHQTLGFMRIGAHQCIDLQQDIDCWCLSLGDSHPVAEPISFQALLQARRSAVVG